MRLGNRKTGLSPPVKYFTDRSKVVLLLWIFYVFSVLRLLCLCAGLFICALCSSAGKGLASCSYLLCLTVSLSLSHWYPGSGVVLDCIADFIGLQYFSGFPSGLKSHVLISHAFLSQSKFVPFPRDRAAMCSKPASKTPKEILFCKRTGYKVRISCMRLCMFIVTSKTNLCFSNSTCGCLQTDDVSL